MYGKVDYYYRREKINMKRLSEDLSAWLVKQGVITIEDIELYEYAVYSFLLLLVPVTIVFIYGIFSRNFLESVSVVVTVIAFRKYCGGYHAKYSWMCMIFSCGSIFLCLYLADRIKYSAYINLLVIITGVMICFMGPIDSENRRLDENEKKLYAKKTVLTTVVFVGLYFLLLMVRKKLSICMFLGMVLVAGLQKIGVITEGYMEKIKDIGLYNAKK